MFADLEAYLPEDYAPDPRERINLYKSLANARGPDRVEEIAFELNDRFGKHPEPVRWILGLSRVRILAAGLGCEKVTVRPRPSRRSMLRPARLRAFRILRRPGDSKSQRPIPSLRQSLSTPAGSGSRCMSPSGRRSKARGPIGSRSEEVFTMAEVRTDPRKSFVFFQWKNA